MSRTEKDPLQRKLEIRNWIVLGILAAISYFAVSTPFALGIACGGIISIANFHWLYAGLRKAFLQVSDKTKSAIMIRYYIRFALTGIVLYLLITKTPVSVFGLLIGLSIVAINIVLTAFLEVSKKNFILKTKEVN